VDVAVLLWSEPELEREWVEPTTVVDIEDGTVLRVKWSEAKSKKNKGREQKTNNLREGQGG
jgi:hypothetical protein